MSWNIEIAAIRTPETSQFDEFMPDVFDGTNEQVSWERATSCEREKDMCAGWLSGWGIIVDILCRLSGAKQFLQEATRNTELYVFRIANDPLEVYYKNGKKKSEHVGIESLLLALGKNSPKENEYIDGETIAREWIAERTGLDFDESFRSTTYEIFTLP